MKTLKHENNFLKILDVKIDIISKQEVLDKIKNLLTPPFRRPTGSSEPPLKSEGQYQLVTTNPEFILAAQKDEEFKNIINNSWLSVVDGYGIRLAAKYLSLIRSPEVSSPRVKPVKPLVRTPAVSNGLEVIKKFFIGMKIAYWGITRNDKKLDVITDVITGTDLIHEICKVVSYQESVIRVFLLGGFGDVPKLAAERLQAEVETRRGASLQIGYSIFEQENIIDKINNAQPSILFVALNAPRAQKWIDENLNKMPSVKLAIGVGGAFDYISGKIKRAPQNWQGFEWLYRLVRQPKRLGRIYRASILFPWKIFMVQKPRNNQE